MHDGWRWQRTLTVRCSSILTLGVILWSMGMLMTVKATAGETGDTCSGYGGDLSAECGSPVAHSPT